MNDQFGESRRHAMARRCRDEALAVQDMLTSSPPPPGRVARAVARLVVAVRGLGHLVAHRDGPVRSPLGADDPMIRTSDDRLV